MRKLISMACLLAATSASADVAGVYNCSASIQNVVTAGGMKYRSKTFSSSVVTLLPDGTTTSVNPISPYTSHGTYTVSKSKIMLTPNIFDVARDATYGCALSGASCIFVGATSTSVGTLNKAQTKIKGISKINLTLMVNEQIRVNQATSKYTCTK